MRIARRVEDANGYAPSALTIGNFDGVHIGHRQLFQQLIDTARQNGLPSTVLTFDPHPARIVAPERAPRLLTTLEERAALVEEQGIEQVLILPFTKELAGLTPEQFVRQIVVGVLGAKVVLVGENFRFGHQQAGNTRVLIELGKHYGYSVNTVGAVKCRGRVVSSTEVRRRIEGGEAGIAARLLGRPYALSGQVVSGHGIGAKQTVPTLNLHTAAEVLPRTGVYITRTQDLDDGRRWNSMSNIGYRPTFNGDSLSIETFLLEPLNGAAPRNIRVEILRRVRDERKFDSPEDLKAQIVRDAGRAQRFFRRLARWTGNHPSVDAVR